MTDHAADETGKAGDRQSAPAVSNPVVIGIGGGVAAGIASSFIPMGAIEGFVSAYGIAELLPAAAPPLGNTARLVLSTGIGTLTAGALFALLPREETQDMGFEASASSDTVETADFSDTAAIAQPAESASLATGSRFAGWLRTLRFGKASPAPGTVTDFADITRNRIRQEDQHPDAPTRAPILASSDLGAPLDTPEGQNAPYDAAAPTALAEPPFDLAEDMAVSTVSAPPAPSMRFAPPPEYEPAFAAAVLPVDLDRPLGDEALERVLAIPAGQGSVGYSEQPDVTTRDPLLPTVAQTEPLDHLSIAELLQRLESGLQRRMAQSGKAAPEKPAPDGRRIRLAEVDSVPFAITDDSDEPAQPIQPPRFRMQGNDERPGALSGGTSWHGDVEYQEPAVGTDFGATIKDVASQFTDAQSEPSYSTPEIASGAQRQAPADDDMDAALRDALATLRQLSDRQRNA